MVRPLGPYLDRKYPTSFRERRILAICQARVRAGRGPLERLGRTATLPDGLPRFPFTQHMGYAEVRRILNPLVRRSRIGYLRASAFPGSQTYEFAAGFVLPRQLIKFSFTIQQEPITPARREHCRDRVRDFVPRDFSGRD